MLERTSVKLLDDPSLLLQYTQECSISELLELWRSFAELNFAQSGLQQRFWGLLSPELRGVLLLELTEDEEEDILQYFFRQGKAEWGGTESLVQALVALEPDERVDILQRAHPDICFALLQNFPEKEKKETQFLLPFQENQAAGIMTTRYSELRKDLSVSEALSLIRSSEELADLELFYYHYIVDSAGKLHGVLSLKELLLAADQEPISEIMVQDLRYVESHAEQEEVIALLEEYDLLAIPVLNHDHRMLGVVTFDDVMDLIRQEQAQNISNLGGVSGQRADLMDNFLYAPVLYLLAQRLPWLVLLLLAGTLTSSLLEHFQDFIVAVPLLTIFIPLITQTGGNVGSQSSVLMIRSISAHNIHFGNLLAALLKEFFVALILASIMGLLVFGRNIFFLAELSWQRNMVISMALGAVVLFAALIGIFVPLCLSALKIDPTVASGPLMATVIDVMGLGLYFIIMQFFVGYFTLT